MCNLYSVTKSQQAIRDLKAVRHLTGNMPPLPAVVAILGQMTERPGTCF